MKGGCYLLPKMVSSNRSPCLSRVLHCSNLGLWFQDPICSVGANTVYAWGCFVSSCIVGN